MGAVNHQVFAHTHGLHSGPRHRACGRGRICVEIHLVMSGLPLGCAGCLDLRDGDFIEVTWPHRMQTLWQMPHFYALAWRGCSIFQKWSLPNAGIINRAICGARVARLHRADYVQGGYNMPPGLSSRPQAAQVSAHRLHRCRDRRHVQTVPRGTLRTATSLAPFRSSMSQGRGRCQPAEQRHGCFRRARCELESCF